MYLGDESSRSKDPFDNEVGERELILDVRKRREADTRGRNWWPGHTAHKYFITSVSVFLSLTAVFFFFLKSNNRQ